ncbi:MAG: SMI1/KNR4 family protein [Chloroflexi bacterium]|nr:SMI1/KNR4 family protein [Chloroflexota bacterium]
MMKQLRITLSMSQNLTGDLILRGNPTLNAYSKLIPELWRQVLMNLRPLDDVLEEIWSPVIKNARGLVFRIVNMTQDLGLVVSAEKNFAPKLFYITNQDGEHSGWLAGSPATSNALQSREEQLQFALPGAYKGFVRIHNGMMEHGDQTTGILPIEHARLLSREGGQNTQNDDEITSKYLLAFCAYRSGNLQCFDLASPIGAHDFMTVKWDPQTRQLSRQETFWGFLKRFAIDFLK